MTRYLLDANVFIQAKNLHYGFDFCPAFWDFWSIGTGSERGAMSGRIGDGSGDGYDRSTE